MAVFDDLFDRVSLLGGANGLRGTRQDAYAGKRLLLVNVEYRTAPLVIRTLSGAPSSDAMVRTTTAPTIFQAGTKDNVLPSQARAVVNFRDMRVTPLGKGEAALRGDRKIEQRG